MPRSARELVDGGVYHVLTRGNNGQAVFHDSRDYQRYLQLLSTYAGDHQLSVYHFALMPNHVHLILGVPVGEALSKTMLGLNLAYALFYRRRYDYTGHLWQGRFKSLLIDRKTPVLECGRYVELIPVRAGLVSEPGAYAWSSYRVYAAGADNPAVSFHPLYEALGPTRPDRQQRYRQFVMEGIRQELSQSLSRYGLPDSWSEPGSTLRRKAGRPRKPHAEADE